MQDVELFVHLAEIAGVFVGFGALIAVRSGGATGAEEVAPMRAMVSFGVVAVIAALAPVTLSRFGIAGHLLWAVCAAILLAGWAVTLAAMLRTPEYREGWAKDIEADRTVRSLPQVILGTGAFLLYVLASLLTPIAVLLGVAPEQEEALYFTAVVLVLLGAAWTLLMLVFAQRTPATG